MWNVSAESKIARFENALIKTCEPQKINKLLIKKSLIELINGDECSGKFTGLILSQCDKLKCNQLKNIYLELERVRSGSVVGD